MGVLNGVEIVDGKVEQAGQFFGNGRGYVKLPDENGQYPANDFTIMAWVLIEDGDFFFINFAMSSSPSENGGIMWGWTRRDCESPTTFVRQIADFFVPNSVSNGNLKLSEPTLPVGRWAQIGIVREGRLLSFLINGKIDSQHTTRPGTIVYDYGSYDDDSVNLGIWKRTGHVATISSYKGLMDELMLFDRALSDQEIADIYAAQAGR